LLVENDGAITTILKFSFMTCGGFDLEVCDSSIEAIHKIAEFAPDAVFLDDGLSEKNGLLTLQALRMLPEMDGIPLIFVTARNLQSEFDKLFDLGATDVIARPFDPFSIPVRVANTWERARV